MQRVLPFVVIAVATSTGFAQDEPPPESLPPAFKFPRWNEDWSQFNPALTGNPWDQAKHIALSDDGSVWLSLGGQARARMESWSSFNFGATPNDDETFLLTRVLLHGDLHLNDNLRFFVEGKGAYSTERDLPGSRRALDVDTAALEQAFAEITLDLDDGARLSIRPGRQTFLFGKQRLVSPLPWANTLRRWDGVSAVLSSGAWRTEAFWSYFVPVQKYDFNDADDDLQFFGIYATGTLSEDTGLDLYALGLDRGNPVTVNGTTGDEQRYTFGGRIFGNRGNFDFDFEGAYQTGEVGDGDVSAGMIGTEIGWTFTEHDGTPRLSLGFDYGSGDDEAGGDVETFNQLFPLGHAYLGAIDVVGRQNIISLNAAASSKVFASSTLLARGYVFWRAESADALYNAGGRVVRPGDPTASDDVGFEIDFTLKHPFNRHLVGLFGYSHFFTGDFLEETGASEDTDFFYAQFQLTF